MLFSVGLVCIFLLYEDAVLARRFFVWRGEIRECFSDFPSCAKAGSVVSGERSRGNRMLNGNNGRNDI